MALRSEYEVVRASLLHQHPLPSLDAAILEIIFEETHLNLDKTPQSDTTLVNTRSSHKKPCNQPTCKNCNKNGHSFSTCPTVECRYCHSFGHILEHCPIRPPRPKVGFSKSANNVTKPAPPSITAAATESSNAITLSDLEALLKQVISSNNSTTMSATSGNSHWLFDSACCNHMIANINLLPSATSIYSLPPIHTTNGTKMNISHIEHITASNLSLIDAYFVPNLTLNLISVGELCEKGLNVLFSPSGVQVQDPQTK
ncbi:Zinc finger, CCHC-type [Sesbania bispinosa]|nr:Zinc finger, CCHC-type [Sesbania bispinosa]